MPTGTLPLPRLPRGHDIAAGPEPAKRYVFRTTCSFLRQSGEWLEDAATGTDLETPGQRHRYADHPLIEGYRWMLEPWAV
jgi:hypothetical protein